MCPISKAEIEQGKTYNICIDNSDGNAVADYRLIYIKGILSFFYEKRRPRNDRFSNTNSNVILRQIKDEFTKEEVDRIEEVCKRLGADYGELDVLRDKNTKKIYVVDVAKTPCGTPNGLPKRMARLAIDEMSYVFAKNILLPATSAHEKPLCGNLL